MTDETKIKELRGVHGEARVADSRGWIHIAEFPDSVGVQIRNEIVCLTPDQARRLATQLLDIADRTALRLAPPVGSAT